MLIFIYLLIQFILQFSFKNNSIKIFVVSKKLALQVQIYEKCVSEHLQPFYENSISPLILLRVQKIRRTICNGKINAARVTQTLKTGSFLNNIFCVHFKKKLPKRRFLLLCVKISNKHVFIINFAIDIQTIFSMIKEILISDWLGG